MNLRLLPFAGLVFVTACSGDSPASPAATSAPIVRPSVGSSTPGPSVVSPSAVPSISPAAQASGTEMTVTLIGDRPVIVPGDGPPDRVAVMPAAVAADADGSLVAFLVWFGSARGDQQVTVARSTDGRAWSIEPGPIYVDFGMTLSPPGAIPGAALRRSDGTWLLYGWAATTADRASFVTWRATAPAPEGPWTMAAGEDRVLPPGPAGAWDDKTAAVSAVLADDSGFALWYDGQRAEQGVRGGIGYASSADGVGWTRFDDPATSSAGDPARPTDGDPVIGPGDCGPVTGAAALGAQVWRRGDGYLMVFGGNTSPDGKLDLLGATSDDGIHWSCTGQVLLRAADIPASEGIESIQGATLAGQPVVLVESLVDGGTEIWLATVSDGP